VVVDYLPLPALHLDAAAQVVAFEAANFETGFSLERFKG
jgi:hypothetical protein